MLLLQFIALPQSTFRPLTSYELKLLRPIVLTFRWSRFYIAGTSLVYNTCRP